MPLSLPASLLTIVIAALLAPVIIRYARAYGGVLLALVPFSACALLLSQVPLMADGGALIYHVEWFASLDTSFDLRLDGLSLLMGILIPGVGGWLEVKKLLLVLEFLYALGHLLEAVFRESLHAIKLPAVFSEPFSSYG